MISPSEQKGLALGLRLLAFDRTKRKTMIDGKPLETKVYARFESPVIIINEKPTGKHILHSYAKSRAGAWRHAVRWLRQLQDGRLV